MDSLGTYVRRAMAGRLGMLITAGPTREPIDAVRYVANRSSGRLGVCLAAAARDAGWDVTLLLGPGSVPAPDGVRTCSFETTAELASLLEEHFPRCDVLIMAAAVADYRPRRVAAAKEVRAPVLVRYERTRRGRTPIALFPLRQDACSHCHTAVPLQRRQIIMQGQSIEACEGCGVLLYVERGPA